MPDTDPEMPVFDVPGVYTCTWAPRERAVIGRWFSFRGGPVREIVTRHVEEGRRLGARSCIVDVTGVTDTLTPEDADWVAASGTMLPAAGIPVLINVVPSWEPDRSGSERWASSTHSHGTVVYTCGSLVDALAITEVLAPAG